jgi:hypothetical protein
MRQSNPQSPLRALSAMLLLALAACSDAAPDAVAGDLPGQPARSASGDPAAVRLQLRADGLPDNLREIDAAATALARRKERDAMLFDVVFRPRSNDPGKTASVTYSYYLPGSRREVTVVFVNMLVALPPDQVEPARRAGVLAMIQKSIDDANLPKVVESAGRRDSPAPEPLPPARVELREAHAVALRAGLRKFDGARLTASARDPAKRFAVWAFAGDFPGNDKSRAIYVDALSGRPVPEREVYAATFEDEQRRSSAETAAAFDALRRSAARGGGGGPGGSSCLDSCAYNASQCSTLAYRNTDTPSANAAATQCVADETRCRSTCP